MSEQSPRRPLRDEIYKQVLELLVQGALPPGGRIVESVLAAELGVSRTPLREALLRLESEEFVQSDLARGFSARRLTAGEVREMYPIMETLETLALRLSGRLAAIDLPTLVSLNAEFASASTEPASALELDIRWHTQLLAHCPNRRLLDMIADLRRVIERYERVYVLDSALIMLSVKQHKVILSALEREDLPAATLALAEHWRFGMDTLLVRLRDEP